MLLIENRIFFLLGIAFAYVKTNKQKKNTNGVWVFQNSCYISHFVCYLSMGTTGSYGRGQALLVEEHNFWIRSCFLRPSNRLSPSAEGYPWKFLWQSNKRAALMPNSATSMYILMSKVV